MKLKKFLMVLSAGFLLNCEQQILPSVGPSRQDILNSSVQKGGTSYILNVNDSLARALKTERVPGFPSSFFTKRTASYETIAAGDSISIRVWENSDNGVFATLGSRVTALPSLRVNETGKIFVPYVGELHVTGKTTEQLRREITAILEPQTPDPQVEVSRLSGRKRAVTIISSGRASQVALNEGNLTLLSMLAQSGGSSPDPLNTRVTLKRGNQSGTIFMTTLYENARYDIPLRHNDRITILPDQRTFSMLGSAGKQSLRKFPYPELSLLDAITAAGGLRATTSDPTGIFVLRTLSAREANYILSRSDFTTPQRFVFTVNLSEPDGLYVADKFMIRDEDIIYMTEAPFVTWMNVIGTMTRGVGAVGDIIDLRNTIEDWGTQLTQ